MGLTDQEASELRDLRLDAQRAKDIIHRYESELLSTELAITNLRKNKKGRWIGFVLFLTCFIIVAAIVVSYISVQYHSAGDTPLAGALNFSVSTTVLTFIYLVFGFLMIATIVSGVKTIAELGNSSSAVALARRFGLRNYPSELKEYEETYNTQIREIESYKMQAKEGAARLKELEAKETPWYEQ